MKHALLAALLVAWSGLALANAPEYGPDDPIGRLIAHADSLRPEWHITRPQEALACLLERGSESSLALLETTIADPGTPDGYKQWLLERIPWDAGGGKRPVPCGGAQVLTNLLAPNRLEPPAWALCFSSLAMVLGGAPECIEQQHLDLIKGLLANEDFLGLPSALRILGAAAGQGANAPLRRAALDLFWQGYERLVDMEGDLAPDARRLSDILGADLQRLPERYPAAVDRELVDWVAEALERCGKADADCERAADLLLSTLCARPDLRAVPNWAALRGALFNGHGPRELPEGTLLAIANLLPSAPQWIDEAAVEAFLEALVEKDSALRKPGSRSYFGGATECLSACAIYGTQPQLRQRILAALWRIALEEGLEDRAHREALSALAAIAWNRPELIDAEFKRTTLARAARARPEGFNYDSDNGALALLQLSIEMRPDLTSGRDLEVIRDCYTRPKAAFNPGIEGAILALASTCSEELYGELEAMLREWIVAVGGAPDIGSGNAADSEQRLLTRVRCVRAGLGPCE